MASRAFTSSPPMASRWRRRVLCVLADGGETIVALRAIDGHGAVVETGDAPPLGRAVTLRHPDAGAMPARVVAHMRDAIRIAFERPDLGIPFALAAIVSDMTRP